MRGTDDPHREGQMPARRAGCTSRKARAPVCTHTHTHTHKTVWASFPMQNSDTSLPGDNLKPGSRNQGGKKQEPHKHLSPAVAAGRVWTRRAARRVTTARGSLDRCYDLASAEMSAPANRVFGTLEIDVEVHAITQPYSPRLRETEDRLSCRLPVRS